MCIGMERPKRENVAMMDDTKKQHEDAALDEALEESFPASDPIAVHAVVPDPIVKPRSKRRKRPVAKRKTSNKKRSAKKKPGKKRSARRPAKKRARKTRRRRT